MSVRAIEAEVSIKSGVSAECTIGREVVVEIHDDVNLESLTVTANGSYEPSEGVDGYSDVTVSVPERIPVTESLSVTENGTYEPIEGIDGYDRVVVAVPLTIPDIEPLTVTANGVYTAEGDGFNPVTVNVEIPKDTNICEGEFEGTETGVLAIDTGYEGDSYPRLIAIYPADGLVDISVFNAPIRALNVITVMKINQVAPTYPETESGNENQMRISYIYKSSSVGFSSSSASGNVFSQASNDNVFGATAFLRMSDNRHMRIFVADDGTTNFLPTGIRYKYKVFY